MPTAPEGAPASSFWAVSAGLLLLSSTGASLTALTVMVATTVLPPRPASPLAVEAWTVKLPLPLKLAVGVNLSPALPFGKRDKRAVGDLRRAVVLVQRAVADAGDLEVRHLGTIGGVARDHEPAGRLRVLVGRGIGHRGRVGHRVDHQAGGVGGRGEGRRAAVAGGVGQRAARATGLVPGPEGDRAGQGAVVVGVGLEVEPRVGIRRQQRALLLATAPRAFQLAPLSVEYHQAPLVVSAAVTAMPSNAPLSTSRDIVHLSRG